MNPAAFFDLLRADGLLAPGDPDPLPLTGGVSSDIYLVRSAARGECVVKRALPQLKTAMEWRADPARNRAEQDCLRFIGAFLPAAVPALLPSPPDRDYFAMEFLGAGFLNWKSELLAGRCDPSVAALAGSQLGCIHAHAWGDPAVRSTFDHTPLFHQLRTSPYLLTTGDRHPALRDRFYAEAARLEATRETLVHGDYSPKNMLLGPGRLVILDCEVAWFGDPSFDLAFLLNHLHLKAVHRPASGPALRAAVAAFSAAYSTALGHPGRSAAVLARLDTLLPMLMLARIDGKSPVEYFDEAARSRVRAFLLPVLSAPPAPLSTLSQTWFDHFASPLPAA